MLTNPVLVKVIRVVLVHCQCSFFIPLFCSFSVDKDCLLLYIYQILNQCIKKRFWPPILTSLICIKKKKMKKKIRYSCHPLHPGTDTTSVYIYTGSSRSSRTTRGIQAYDIRVCSCLRPQENLSKYGHVDARVYVSIITVIFLIIMNGSWLLIGSLNHLLLFESLLPLFFSIIHLHITVARYH